ncbi:linear amide C-N hydrolase [Pannus brasiliensis CCIBt3594]|uniref:Linear amide C-N hydrolase n=1 Tax=Pannus brasiliensis CCIBt3594 TaxID=1427578 RepID=A0AAW9QW60_9CHRO
MRKLQRCRKLAITALSLVVAFAPIRAVFSCSRAMYVGPNGMIVTTRSNDWIGSQGTHLWMYPRGLKRDGAGGPGSIAWTSKYGSVTTAGWDIATIDGLNEKGLVANVLYLAESDYGKPSVNDRRKPLSITAWGQYVLDNFATVAEAVEALRKEPFYIVPVETPDGHAGTAHLSISDPSGDSAIFEYVNGKLVIHHAKEYKVMTNSPVFDQQLALNAYWENIGGSTMLPGTNRAADRFVRASFYMDAVKKTDDTNEALAAAMSVIRNVSVPVGITTPGQPNIASTQWRTMSDQKNKVYYFESAFSPYLLAIDLKKVNFSEGAPVKKLALTDRSALIVEGKFISGEVSDYFQPARPFEFLGTGR